MIRFDDEGCYEQAPDGSLRIAAPEPYWFRPWWAFFRWKPGCWDCKTIYKTRGEYYDHFISHHAYRKVDATKEGE